MTITNLMWSYLTPIACWEAIMVTQNFSEGCCVIKTLIFHKPGALDIRANSLTQGVKNFARKEVLRIDHGVGCSCLY